MGIFTGSGGDRPATPELLSGEGLATTDELNAETSARESADAAEATARAAADSALDGRVTTLEADPTTKTYVDAQDATEATARAAADTSEATTRAAADTALDGRVTTLEADPTTKTYVDAQDAATLSSAEAYTDAHIPAGGAMPATTTLDEIPAPTADVSLNNHKLTGLQNPVGDQDAATKAYVDAIKQGLDVKDSVRVASTANVNLASAPASIDGVSLNANDRVLLRSQTTGSENGIYVFSAAGAALNRASDADDNTTVTTGMFCWVEEGTQNGSQGYVLTTHDPITVGTTSLTFTQFSGLGQITAGSGLSKSGNTLSANFGSSAGTVTQGNDSRLSDERTPLDGSVTKVKTSFTISDLFDSVSRIKVALAGVLKGTRREINFIEGTGIALTFTDDATNEKVDVQIDATGDVTPAPGTVDAASLGTVTDGITTDQLGAGDTIEVKAGGIGSTQLASGAVHSTHLDSSVTSLFDSAGAASAAQAAAATDATTKANNAQTTSEAYTDSQLQQRDFKQSVRAASTANVNVASAPSTIDGVALANGDRVLLKDQTTASENGIYTFASAGSALTRATDANSSAKVTSGASVYVEEGTTNGTTQWRLTTPQPITLGTSGLTFQQTGGIAGAYPGVDSVTLDTSGAGGTIEVKAASIDTAQLKNGAVTTAKMAAAAIASFDAAGAAAAAQSAAEAASMPVGTTLDAVPHAAADVNVNSHKLTNVNNPTSAQDAATMDYVDTTKERLDYKDSVRAASTANVNTASAPSSIDGVALAANDRVLLKDQSTASQNGIYVFSSAGAALNRAVDANDNTKVTTGLTVFVSEGTANAGTVWRLATHDPITLGTTGLSFIVAATSAGAYPGVDNATLDASGSGSTLEVKAGGIGTTQLADGSATTAKLADDNATWGDGSDGAVTLGANITLARDMYYDSLDMAGFNITTAGWRIFVKNTLTLSGTIKNDGTDGSGATGGTQVNQGTTAGNAGGGAGQTGNGSPGQITGFTAGLVGAVLGAASGNGGAGGTGSAGSGVTPGVNAAKRLPRDWNTLASATDPSLFTSGVRVSLYSGGCGGGGGGGDGTNAGGGGGAGGGIVYLLARTIVWSGGTISAKGGNGASTAAGNTGGGGGGGGGVVLLGYHTMSGSSTYNVAGGTHGTGHGTGANGSDGSNGATYILQH